MGPAPSSTRRIRWMLTARNKCQCECSEGRGGASAHEFRTALYRSNADRHLRVHEVACPGEQIDGPEHLAPPPQRGRGSVACLPNGLGRSSLSATGGDSRRIADPSGSRPVRSQVRRPRPPPRRHPSGSVLKVRRCQLVHARAPDQPRPMSGLLHRWPSFCRGQKRSGRARYSLRCSKSATRRS